MAIVIKEIIVKTTVEPEKQPEREMVLPSDWIERIKEEVLKEVERTDFVEPRRKER